jgi:hypothetical protein
LDDVTAARMPELLAREDFVNVFVETYPAFADYRDWVEQLTGALREAVVDEDDEEPGAADVPATDGTAAAGAGD